MCVVDFQDFRSHVQREYFPHSTSQRLRPLIIRSHDRFPSQRAKHDDIPVLRRHRRVLFDVPDDDDVAGVFQVRPFRERAVVIQRSCFRWRGDRRFASRVRTEGRRTPPPPSVVVVVVVFCVAMMMMMMMVLLVTTTTTTMITMMDTNALQSEA